MLLLLRAYLSFVDSFFRGITVFLNFVQSIALIFIYARKNLFNDIPIIIH